MRATCTRKEVIIGQFLSSQQLAQIPFVALEFLVQVYGFAVARHGEQG